LELLKHDLIVIDVESNGLWGQPFAVGAVCMTAGGRVLRTFRSRCNIDEVPDEWIVENEIEEKLSHFPLVEGQRELIAGFVNWLIQEENLAAGVFVDVGFPVDTGFLGLFKLLDPQWRKYAPYPLLEVSSIIMSAGASPRVDREEYAKELIGEKTGMAHDPVWDAEVSGLCVIRALRKLQELLGER